MVLSSWQAIARVLPVHLMNANSNPQTKPTNLACESSGRLLPSTSTSTIAIYYYYSAHQIMAIEPVCVCVRACRMLPSCWCTWNFLTSISGYTRQSCVLPTQCCGASTPSDSFCFSLDRSRPAVTSAAVRFTSAPPGTRKRHIGVTGWDLPGQIFTSQPSVTCRMFNGRNSVIFGKLFFPENQRV